MQETLEVIFVMADGKGVLPLPNPYTPNAKPQQQLTRLHIAPCAATDLKVTPHRQSHLVHWSLHHWQQPLMGLAINASVCIMVITIHRIHVHPACRAPVCRLLIAVNE